MNDYIYGYQVSDGSIWLSPVMTEESSRRYSELNDRTVAPVCVPVSAIETLPAPKPVLPTTVQACIALFESYGKDDAAKFLAEHWDPQFDAYDEGKIS